MWSGKVGSNVLQVRDHNRFLVLQCLYRQEGVSRSEIAQRIGLTQAGVSRIVRDLIDEGVLHEVELPPVPGSPGRRSIALHFVGDAAFVVSICLTVFEQRLNFIDLCGHRRHSEDLSEVVHASGESILKIIAAAVCRGAKAVGVSLDHVLGLALSTVGSVDREAGRVVASSIEGLCGLVLAVPLQRMLGLPVSLATASEAINVGERVQYERKGVIAEDAGTVSLPRKDATLLVHVAFGMGANILIDGKSYGEREDERAIAHIPVPGASDVCICGAKGCLLTVASGHSIMGQFRHLNRDTQGGTLSDSRSEDLLSLIKVVQTEKREAADLFRHAGERLGRALFGVTACLPVDRIILAGIVGRTAPYAEGVRTGVHDVWTRYRRSIPKIVSSELDYGMATDIWALTEYLLNRELAVDRLRKA